MADAQVRVEEDKQLDLCLASQRQGLALKGWDGQKVFSLGSLQKRATRDISKTKMARVRMLTNLLQREPWYFIGNWSEQWTGINLSFPIAQKGCKPATSFQLPIQTKNCPTLARRIQVTYAVTQPQNTPSNPLASSSALFLCPMLTLSLHIAILLERLSFTSD